MLAQVAFDSIAETLTSSKRKASNILKLERKYFFVLFFLFIYF